MIRLIAKELFKGEIQMNSIHQTLEMQRGFYGTGVTRGLDFRLRQLGLLKKAILSHEQEILDALKKDLNREPFDTYAAEIGIVLEEISFLVKHLPRWAAARRVKTSLANFPGSSRIYPEPYGIALILSPWNYPFQLAILPLAGALAAGNCAVVKSSAYSVHTSLVIEKMIRATFPEEYVSVVLGGREENRSLLEERFDYIFFTGSVAVGKTVMESAARHLTPVTLELGGKSPCIVDESASLAMAARRIVWGKFFNAGQTCVAPDYLMVHRDVKERLIAEIRSAAETFYGPGCDMPESFPRIVNEKHFDRLLGLLENEKVIFGGCADRASLRIGPTLVDQATWGSPLMQGEIFGPILPILEFGSLEEVIDQVNAHPKPLALYYFTTCKDREKRVLSRISFGGGCINDTVMHLASSYMPFGGVGESGMGQYHGKASFETFSHYKSILKKSNLLDIPLRYPTHRNMNLLKRILK